MIELPVVPTPEQLVFGPLPKPLTSASVALALRICFAVLACAPGDIASMLWSGGIP